MPVSSLVLTLDSDPTARTAALSLLGRVDGLTVGEGYGVRLPAVLETDSLSQGRDVVESLLTLCGVQFVDVVGVNFEDAEF